MTRICQINRVKNSFDRDTPRTIISALVLTKLFYCSTVWSNTTATNIKKLQAVQNFACRIITKTKKFEYITPALREIKWLPVNGHLLYRHCNDVQVHEDASLFIIITLETENPLTFLQARQSQASDVSSIEQSTFGTIQTKTLNSYLQHHSKKG